MADNPIKKGRYKSLRRKASSIREKKRYVERYNRHNSSVKQFRAIRQQRKSVFLNYAKTGFTIFSLIVLFLLIATLARRISYGTAPSFTELFAYLSSMDAPTIPFNNQSGLVLGLLEFIFSNAIQGLTIFLDILRFLFFG